MGKYVTKRVLLAIVTVFIVCGITFFAMNAIPGGPFDGEKALSPEVKEALENGQINSVRYENYLQMYEELKEWEKRKYN